MRDWDQALVRRGSAGLRLVAAGELAVVDDRYENLGLRLGGDPHAPHFMRCRSIVQWSSIAV